jgi:hypothetical protein
MPLSKSEGGISVLQTGLTIEFLHSGELLYPKVVLLPAFLFFLTFVIAPMEVEDFEIHDEHDGITDSGEHLDEEGDESQDDNLDQELDVNLDGMLPNFTGFWSLDRQRSAHAYCAPVLLVTKRETTTRV